MLLVGTSATAQNLRERGEVRRGNKAYLREDYGEAAEHYGAAMEYAPSNFEARYNLGSALLKGEQMEQAEQMLAEVAADSLLSDSQRSISYFNLGNSQFAQQKLEEALKSYKEAMRYDPDDMEAKYNYAYTKALLQQQEQDGGGGEGEDDQEQNQDQDQNQDQGQDQDQNQNQDQNQDGDNNQDQDEQQGDQNEQPQDEQEQEQQGEPEPREGQISDQELQQMLDAIQAQEDKTQEDLKEKGRGVVIPGAKNW